jgi:hypothetical protein
MIAGAERRLSANFHLITSSVPELMPMTLVHASGSLEAYDEELRRLARLLKDLRVKVRRLGGPQSVSDDDRFAVRSRDLPANGDAAQSVAGADGGPVFEITIRGQVTLSFAGWELDGLIGGLTAYLQESDEQREENIRQIGELLRQSRAVSRELSDGSAA